jgi:hypothetical protein
MAMQNDDEASSFITTIAIAIISLFESMARRMEPKKNTFQSRSAELHDTMKRLRFCRKTSATITLRADGSDK